MHRWTRGREDVNNNVLPLLILNLESDTHTPNKFNMCPAIKYADLLKNSMNLVAIDTIHPGVP